MIGTKTKKLNISGLIGNFFTQLLRTKVDAVVVGPRTTAIDQPNLNFRFDQFNKEFFFKMKNIKNQIYKESQNYYFLNKFYYDEFLRGIFIFYDSIIKNTKTFLYQPLRIFIIGRYFDNFINFYNKQILITKETNQKFFFLIQRKYKELYKSLKIDKEFIVDTPDLDDKIFFSFLNEFLIEHNVQKVLFETGLGLFNRIYSELESTDIIYLVERQEFIKKSININNIYFDWSQFNFLLKDRVFLENILIYSLRKF